MKTSRVPAWIALVVSACVVGCSGAPSGAPASGGANGGGDGANGGGGGGGMVAGGGRGGGGSGDLQGQCSTPSWSPPPCPRASDYGAAAYVVGACRPATECYVDVVIADGYHYCHPSGALFVCCANGAALVDPKDQVSCPSIAVSPDQDPRCPSVELTEPCSNEGLSCSFTFTRHEDGYYPPAPNAPSAFVCCGGRWRLDSSFDVEPCTGEHGLVCTRSNGAKIMCGGADEMWGPVSVDAGTD